MRHKLPVNSQVFDQKKCPFGKGICSWEVKNVCLYSAEIVTTKVSWVISTYRSGLFMKVYSKTINDINYHD